jgi:hypothetical protein
VEPEDVAAAVLFLASVESRYVTGITYVLDAEALGSPERPWFTRSRGSAESCMPWAI